MIRPHCCHSSRSGGCGGMVTVRICSVCSRLNLQRGLLWPANDNSIGMLQPPDMLDLIQHITSNYSSTQPSIKVVPRIVYLCYLRLFSMPRAAGSSPPLRYYSTAFIYIAQQAWRVRTLVTVNPAALPLGTHSVCWPNRWQAVWFLRDKNVSGIVLPNQGEGTRALSYSIASSLRFLHLALLCIGEKNVIVLLQQQYVLHAHSM